MMRIKQGIKMIDFGLLANILNAIALIPQVIHTIKSQSVDDMSYMWLLLSWIANMLWILYAVFEDGGLQVLFMGINFSLFYGLLVYYKYKGNQKEASVSTPEKS